MFDPVGVLLAGKDSTQRLLPLAYRLNEVTDRIPIPRSENKGSIRSAVKGNHNVRQ